MNYQRIKRNESNDPSESKKLPVHHNPSLFSNDPAGWLTRHCVNAGLLVRCLPSIVCMQVNTRPTLITHHCDEAELGEVAEGERDLARHALDLALVKDGDAERVRGRQRSGQRA